MTINAHTTPRLAAVGGSAALIAALAIFAPALALVATVLAVVIGSTALMARVYRHDTAAAIAAEADYYEVDPTPTSSMGVILS